MLASAELPSEGGQIGKHALLGWQAGCSAGWSGWRLYCWEGYTSREIGVGVGVGDDYYVSLPHAQQIHPQLNLLG